MPDNTSIVGMASTKYTDMAIDLLDGANFIGLENSHGGKSQVQVDQIIEGDRHAEGITRPIRSKLSQNIDYEDSSQHSYLLLPLSAQSFSTSDDLQAPLEDSHNFPSHSSHSPGSSTHPISTPLKRGRGRPRKYPLVDGDTGTSSSPSLNSSKKRGRPRKDKSSGSGSNVVQDPPRKRGRPRKVLATDQSSSPTSKLSLNIYVDTLAEGDRESIDAQSLVSGLSNKAELLRPASLNPRKIMKTEQEDYFIYHFPPKLTHSRTSTRRGRKRNISPSGVVTRKGRKIYPTTIGAPTVFLPGEKYPLKPYPQDPYRVYLYVETPVPVFGAGWTKAQVDNFYAENERQRSEMRMKIYYDYVDKNGEPNYRYQNGDEKLWYHEFVPERAAPGRWVLSMYSPYRKDAEREYDSKLEDRD